MEETYTRLLRSQAHGGTLRFVRGVRWPLLLALGVLLSCALCGGDP